MNNKNKRFLQEVTDTYSNIDFRDNAITSSNNDTFPSKDDINTSLLDDINTAAKNANVNVSVTTAISGHKTDTPTRHSSGNAVDIAIINNKAVSLSNRKDADKFVDELVNMGYTKNKEIGHDKAVLTFGFPGHDTHVHVSNSSNLESNNEKSSNDTSDVSDKNSEFKLPDGVSLFDAMGKIFTAGLTEEIQRIKQLLK